ncbi:hypothetical protein Aasi_1723 [Candidatus Amoebophilus asiaticus 5a2]|uniref:Uncharacterized protein n=1 Tax=Amoebophilus asiaticus (strain 5a2) TaxID=452471 RepID=C3L3W4_AMOA5|nr:hypothetical protein Aasi_1723 [Candidatus Amoebophilus asiaticus 5a2]
MAHHNFIKASLPIFWLWLLFFLLFIIDGIAAFLIAFACLYTLHMPAGINEEDPRLPSFYCVF